MSVATALSNFNVWRERQQARQDHEQLTTEEDDDAQQTHPLQVPIGMDGDDDDDNHGDNQSRDSSSSPTSTTPMVATVSSDEENQTNVATTPRPTTSPAPVTTTRLTRRGFSLADLEEERELARRRTSFCVLFAVFILFRLWIQAVTTGDIFLLMICLMGTSWTARFIRHTREREEELDRMIAEYNENGGENANGEGNGLNRSELTRLSFQAQLAMAIINSQRDMMQGGFGHPDGGGNTPGVSDEAMEHWNRFNFKPDGKSYGSVSQIDDLEKATKGPHAKDEDEPHCSICLGEYEEGEQLVCLPCKHVYHEDCVSSWCSNHTRCPLCNFDLESVSGDTATTSTASVP